MAIDKSRTKELVDGINTAFDSITAGLPAASRKWLREMVLSAALEEIERVVVNSRPPVLYVMGRSGHGKSSLINALAGKEVAEVGDIKPSTLGADPYLISFPEFFAEWTVVDSRGIFESTRPSGATELNALEQVKQDIRTYKPDVILHVITASEIRSLENDFRAFAEVQKVAAAQLGAAIPAIMVVNKVDILGDPRDWPVAQSAKKAGLIKALLDYIVQEILHCQTALINLNSSIEGCTVTGPATGPGASSGPHPAMSSAYVGIIPVCVRSGDEWNLDTLSRFIGDYLPDSAVLNFFQAQQRKELLRRISSSTIMRFSALAAGIGSAPIPIADIVVLTPLQLLLVAFIAGLSCRSFTLESVAEFAAASGAGVGVAFGLREVVREMVKFVPVLGAPVSGAIAGSATYGMGKAAEAYYFLGEVRSPGSFMGQWLRREKDGDSQVAPS